MAKQYTIKILPSDEFDNLPYKRAKTSLGASDPKTGIAYVRDTGFNDVTKGTMAHELDELLANTSPHEEDGIRYKDFSQAFSSFGKSVPGIGSVLGPVLGAVGQVPDLIGAGVSKVGGMFGGGGAPTAGGFNPGPAPSVAPLRGAGAGIANSMVGSLPNSRNIPSGSFPGFGSALSDLPSSMASRFSSLPAFDPMKSSMLDIFSSKGLPKAGGGFGGAITKATDYIKSNLSDVLSGAEGAFKGGQPTGTGTSNSFGTQIGKAAPGALVSLAGNLFGPKVSPIDTSGLSNSLRQQISGQGVNGPLYSEALNVGRGVLTTPVGEPNEAQFRSQDRAIDVALTKALEENRNAFKARNPGADIEGNSRYAEETARLKSDAARLKSQVRGDAVAQQIQDQLRTMEDMLNIDRAQTQQFIEIAQLDFETLAYNTGISLREAQEFKSIFSAIGEAMIQGQFNKQPAVAVA